MKYYYSRTIAENFESVLNRTVEALKSEGFGILTEIDVRKTLKDKIGEDIGEYRILGACNPQFAFRALQVEELIGTMLPCNVVARKLGEGLVEIAAIDPVASMQAVANTRLSDVASQVKSKLRRAIDAI